MPVISREVIFGKLGEVGMRSLQSAFEFARLRRDAYIEPVHWLAQMLRSDGTDLPLLADRLGFDRGRLTKDLERGLSGLRRAISSRLDFSRDLELSIERGWIVASLVFGAPRIRTGHLLLGLLEQTELKRLLIAISDQFPRSRRRRCWPRFRSSPAARAERWRQASRRQPHRSASALPPGGQGASTGSRPT